MTNTIEDIAKQVATNLGIEPNTLILSIPTDLKSILITNQTLLNKIFELSTADTDIKNFGDDHKLIGTNFDTLKKNLGKLQIFALIKNLEKAKKCDDVLNMFIDTLNKKIGSVNDILQTNLQGGGSKINYYKKYKKYKKKYLLLKKMYDNIY